MKFITSNLFENPDAFAGQLTQVIADPGAFVPRIRHSESDSEPLHVWQARAVISMFQPIEASDGSAQPVDPTAEQLNAAIEHATSVPVPLAHRSPAGEFRALLESAKGVTADQLELTLTRGHLKEASRVFEIVRAENNQLRNFLRVAGDLLGRADADPIKLAQKVEAGIIDLHAKCEGQAKEIERASTRYDGERKAATLLREERDRCRAAYAAERERAVDLQSQVEQERGWLEATRKERDTFRENADDLGREVDKARRVIIGNTGGTIDDSGSLLDMLNVLIERARPNYSSSPSAL